MTNARYDERGVVLIALLWVLTAMGVIALSFSRESYVEVAAARNARELSASHFVARAGITLTIYQLIEKRFIPRVQQVEIEAPPDPLDLGLVTGEFAGGVYEIEVQDESGKINLNFVAEDQLKLLLEAVGILSPEADMIADSIMDWRDVDNAHRINGAEDDYYQTLNPPYKAKNGRMDTVEELLLVRGVTRAHYYGLQEKAPDGSIVHRYGLSRYFTVYSTSNRINVNYAPLPVLLSIPGMPPRAAEMIFERRQTKPFENLEEITRQLAVNLGPTTLPFLSTEPTGIYTLTARAHMKNSRVIRTIRAVATLDPRELNRYKIIYWNENVPIL